MPSPTVVIAQSDPRTAQGLAKDLHAHFSKVAVAQSAVELRTLLLRHEAQVAVLDLEIVKLEEVQTAARGCSTTLRSSAPIARPTSVCGWPR